jgi:predicted dienelactone hydrolase
VTVTGRRRRATGIRWVALLVAGVIATGVTSAVAGRAAVARPLTILDVTYVDTSRSTPATPSSAAADRRVLVTTIRFPTEDTGPLPLIVLAHGLNGHPHMLDELSDAWARAGYVVASPKFPRANLDTNGKAVLADAAEYPADLSFVISKLLAIDDHGEPEVLRGRIDAQHLGVAGISLGGMAVYGLISNTCCRDGRVDAAILMSAVRPPFPRGVYTRQDVPVMLVHGDDDTGYRYSRAAYPGLAAPKWFVTLEGGRHGPPFEDAPDEFDVFARRVTTAFWDRYLREEPAAGQRIVDLVNGSGGRATLRRQLG